MTDDKLWKIITSSHGGVLATTNADGSPQLSNIYYVSGEHHRTIRFSTTTDRTKGRNLLRDRRAALHVSGKNFLSFAVASGQVTVSIADRPDGPAVDELFEIHRALGAQSDRETFGVDMVASKRMAVRIDVTRLYGQVIDREPRPVDS